MELAFCVDGAPLTSRLSVRDMLNVSITSKTIFKSFSVNINLLVLFRYRNTKFESYKPQRMRVGGFFGGFQPHPPSLNPNFSFEFTLLPTTLTHLSFNDSFNQPVDGLLPPTLTRLTFGKHFNQPIFSLPHTLTHLQLGAYFNYLPPSLLGLKLIPHREVGWVKLSTEIYRLPPNLTTFDIPLLSTKMAYLPRSITDLSFVTTKQITLPPNLQRFSAHYDHTFCFPPSLTSLTFRYLNEDDEGDILSLPTNLTTLSVDGHFLMPDLLPQTLTHLTLSSISKNIANNLHTLLNLTHFTYGEGDDAYLFETDVWDLQLPPKLTHLALFSNNHLEEFFSQLHECPLVSLKVGRNSIRYQSACYLPLPPTLTVLSLDKVGWISFPPFLKELSIAETIFEYAWITFPELPSTLRKLDCKHGFSQLLPSLPFGLEELNIPISYYHTIPPLPPTLKKLHIDNIKLNQPLPPSLTDFSIGGTSFLNGKQVRCASEVCVPFPTLPPSLTNLSLNLLQETTLPTLPPFLKHLEVYTTFPLPPLPHTLESLKIKAGSKYIWDFDEITNFEKDVGHLFTV